MLLFFALAVGLVAAQVPPHEYAFGLLPNIPEQYMIASLQDINSEAFAAQYNRAGLDFLQGFPASSPTCCIVTNLLHRHQPVSVAEGFLSFGASDNVSSFLEPFGKGSSVCVGSMSPSNATLGVSPTSPGPYQGMWIPLLVAKEQRAFRVITDGAAPNSTVVSCNGTPLIVILKSVPKYVFRPQGENYTAPNTTEYQVASLAHVMSTEFMDYYNNQTGLLLTGTTTNIGYCCVVKVAEGWLFNRGDAW